MKQNTTSPARLTAVSLCLDHFHGWWSDYAGTEDTDDEWMAAAQPVLEAANLEAWHLCVSLLCFNNMSNWSAWDPTSRTEWDWVNQSYFDFKRQYPDAELFIRLQCASDRFFEHKAELFNNVCERLQLPIAPGLWDSEPIRE